MEHFETISIDDLQQALENTDEKKPAQRLITAIAYKKGVTQTELAEWYGVERRTVYSWLKRLDTDESLEDAVRDAHRSGRNRKLSEPQRNSFEQTVNESPKNAGIDAPAWTPTLAQQHLEETHGVEYSLPSCRRLLKEAGLSYQKSHPSDAKAGKDGNDRFYDKRGKSGGEWIPE